MDKLLLALEQGGFGIEFPEVHIPALAYADDIVLLAKTEEDMAQQLNILMTFLQNTGM